MLHRSGLSSFVLWLESFFFLKNLPKLHTAVPGTGLASRGGGAEHFSFSFLALFVESFRFAEIINFAESFDIKRFTAHDRYL